MQQSRVEHAPRAYLLSQPAASVARQVRLLDHLPGRREARVALYEAGAPDRWEIDVASRDRPALLAHVSGVLVAYGLDVESAVIATWGDGAALESFLVRRAPANGDPVGGAAHIGPGVPPDPAALEQAIVASFHEPLGSEADPEAELTFDDEGSPWYTMCEVRGPDRRGLLHSITVGMAEAGASVHSARLETVAGRAVDRFALTDANGRKLDAEQKDAVVDAIRTGVTPRRRRFRLLSRA
jgi:[protein-PII] uridylyltransferase